MTAAELEQKLEALIDDSRLAGVLDALACVCAEKSSHLSSNWQDDRSAAVWSKYGNRILKIASLAESDGI